MISEDRFCKFDWEDFYPDACKPIPLGMPRPRSKSVLTHCFVEDSHKGDKTTIISMTRILILCNRSPIIWHNKRKNGVEVLTFESEFTAMKKSIEAIEVL